MFIERFAAHFEHLPVGQHDLQTQHVLRAEPYLSQWLPPASMAITLPIVVTLVMAGSGPNCLPERTQDLIELRMDDARLNADTGLGRSRNSRRM